MASASSDTSSDSHRSEIRRNSEIYNDDPLFLQSSDYPGLLLVSEKMNGSNFSSWSRSIKIALYAKSKLGFLDGSCAKPDPSAPQYNQWLRCDYMVLSWLLTAIVPKLSRSFMYAPSAKALWEELSERFGQSNGPLIFQLQKEVTDLRQGADSVAVYYTKLKGYWDELNDLCEVPVCNCPTECTAMKKVMANEQRQKLMQFLMRLDDEYESIRSQILLLDPLPTVNKACSMIQQIEKQKQVTSHLNTGIASEIAATVSSPAMGEPDTGSNVCFARGSQKGKKDNKRDSSKESRFCNHCRRSGHTQDQCFKIIGYPDWYTGPKDGTKGKRVVANFSTQSGDCNLDSPLDNFTSGSQKEQFDYHALAHEMMKLMRNKGVGEQQSESMGSYAHFAGPFN